MTEVKYPVLLFDGHCSMCNAWVRLILRWEKESIYRFAALQSEYGREVLGSYPTKDIPDSVILVENGKFLIKSDVIMAVTSNLKFPFSLAQYIKWLPKGFRDSLYDIIARNRFKLFKRKEECAIPPQNQTARFLG